MPKDEYSKQRRWQAKNKDKVREIQRRYELSEKGKAARKRIYERQKLKKQISYEHTEK